jgi:hypothetical protein
MMVFDASNSKNQVSVARLLGRPSLELLDDPSHSQFYLELPQVLPQASCCAEYFRKDPELYYDWHCALDQVESILRDCLGADCALVPEPRSKTWLQRAKEVERAKWAAMALFDCGTMCDAVGDEDDLVENDDPLRKWASALRYHYSHNTRRGENEELVAQLYAKLDGIESTVQTSFDYCSRDDHEEEEDEESFYSVNRVPTQYEVPVTVESKDNVAVLRAFQESKPEEMSVVSLETKDVKAKANDYKEMSREEEQVQDVAEWLAQAIGYDPIMEEMKVYARIFYSMGWHSVAAITHEMRKKDLELNEFSSIKLFHKRRILRALHPDN